MQAAVAQQAAVDTISAGKQAAALHNAGPDVQLTTATAAADAVTPQQALTSLDSCTAMVLNNFTPG